MQSQATIEAKLGPKDEGKMRDFLEASPRIANRCSLEEQGEDSLLKTTWVKDHPAAFLTLSSASADAPRRRVGTWVYR